jgi:FkbM family methyltransferase
MNVAWRALKFLPPPLISFVKRHSNSKTRFWLRQRFGAAYSTIPDEIRRLPDGRLFHIGPDYAYWTIYLGIGHEPETTRLVRQLIHPGDTIVDIGANFGWYTTALGQAVDGRGRVYSFEPVPSTYARLLEHLELNNMGERVVPIRAAVGDAPGIAKVYVFKDLSHGCASLARLDDDKECQVFEAPVIRLDEFLREQHVNVLDFLKCDAEGSELAALKGCGDFLRSHDAPILLVEINEETSRCFGYGKIDVWRYLVAVGYDYFFEVVSGDKIRRIRSVEEIRDPNLLCAKRERIGKRLATSKIAVAGQIKDVSLT